MVILHLFLLGLYLFYSVLEVVSGGTPFIHISGGW